MTKQTSADKSDSNRVTAILDNRAWTNWILVGYRGPVRYTLRRIRSDLLRQRLNPTDISIATLSRLSQSPLHEITGPRSKHDDIAGLGELAISALFRTKLSSDATRMELLLRSADDSLCSGSEALRLLTQADVMLEVMDEEASLELLDIDILTRASLGAQVATYKAGTPNIGDKHKARFFQNAQRRLADCADLRRHILHNVAPCFTDTVVCVRMESLAYFVEYNLRNEPKSDLTAMARRVSQDRVLDAVKTVTEKLGDPRIPINFAEAAGYIAQIEGGGKAETYNKKAKAMIELTLKTAGYTGAVRDFAPDWLKGYRLSEAEELQAAIGLIEASNKE